MGKTSKNVQHTQYDKRYTQANRINNINNNCCKCGTNIHATQLGNRITVRCQTFSFSGQISYCIDYNDILCDFNDNHP